MAGYFPGLSLGETFEQFLDRMVRPDTRYLVSCGEVIDTVVRLIHKHPSYNIKEVIKGGSLGKGTGVRAHSDVDLLVVLNDFRNVDDLRNNMPKILSSFRDYLLAAVNTETGIRIQITKPPTPFTLQFKVCCAEDRDWFEVDLLPVIDVIDPSNVRRSLQVVYDRMEEEYYNRDYYAKCVARQQVEFVKFVPARVKDLIRLIKYWNYNEDVGLSSFCIELLVIHIWKQKGSPNNFKLTPMINDVSEIITSFDETTITFDNYYSPDYYVAMNELKPPYILDPANPFHDAAPHKRVKENYSQIHERGRSLLRERVEAQAQMGSRWFGDVALSSGSDEFYQIKSKSGKLLQLARDIKEKEYVDAVSNVKCSDLSPSSDEDDDNCSRSIKTATTGKSSGLWTALGVGAVLTGGLLAGYAVKKLTTKSRNKSYSD